MIGAAEDDPVSLANAFPSDIKKLSEIARPRGHMLSRKGTS